MNPIISTTITGLSARGVDSGADRTADEDARLRREAERAKIRRMQVEARRDADAEIRLADAMARASARTAQLAKSSLRSLPQGAGLASMDDPDDKMLPGAAVGAGASPVAMTEEARRAVHIAVDGCEMTAEHADAGASLLQRLAVGQSSGLLKDCVPILRSLASQLADGAVRNSEHGQDDVESLQCALDFLQGYAETSAGRLADTDRFTKLVTEVRQLLQALTIANASSGVVLAAAVPQQALHNPLKAASKGLAVHAGKEREPVHAVRKARRAREDEEADHDDGPEVVGAIALASNVLADKEKGATVSESSLDKDQRKRQEDTLPLLTVRSI